MSTIPNDPINGIKCGLTKREYFAAMAMQALMSIPEVQNEWSHNGICREAVKHADALIQALNEGKAVDHDPEA